MTLHFKIGDRVTVTGVPPDLHDGAGLDTHGVFQRALGKTFRVEGIDDYGHLELVVAESRPSPGRFESDTIWIAPELVSLVRKRRVDK